MKKNYIIKTLKNSGIFLLLYIAITITTTSLFILINKDINTYNFGLNLALTGIAFALIFIKNKINEIVLPIIIGTIVLFSGILINQNFLDLSWDGNSYHKDAIGILKNGWNPIRDDYIEFYRESGLRDMDYIGEELTGTHGFWQTYYAKGTWYFASTIYAFTNNIETGKVYNFLAIYISIVLSLYLLNLYTKKIALPIIVSVLFAINPIMIAQVFTYYNDGFLGNLLMLVIFYMTVFTMDDQKISKKELYVTLCSLLLILINTKFTGLGYAGIFCIFYYILYILKKYKEKKLKELLKPTIIFASTVIFSICVVGFSPYITNLADKLPIFYPLMGENKVDIVTHNQPQQFNNKSTIYKFLKSILSEVANMNQESGIKPDLKKPFVVHEEETYVLNAPDLRISGFGVYFSGILMISGTILIFYIVKLLVQKNKSLVYIIIPMAVSLALIFAISESWWARYTQFLYLVPITPLIICLLDKSKIKYICFVAIAVPMIINMGYFVKYGLIRNYEESKVIEKQIENISKEETILLEDIKNEFVGMFYNFDDRNVKYNITTKWHKTSTPFYKWIKKVE